MLCNWWHFFVHDQTWNYSYGSHVQWWSKLEQSISSRLCAVDYLTGQPTALFKAQSCSSLQLLVKVSSQNHFWNFSLPSILAQRCEFSEVHSLIYTFSFLLNLCICVTSQWIYAEYVWQKQKEYRVSWGNNPCSAVSIFMPVNTWLYEQKIL